MSELKQLPNIGAEIERQLNLIGIASYEELKKAGSKEAWLKIYAMDTSACINKLYALEGAIKRIRKVDLTEETKNNLKAFYNEIKG